MKTTRRPTVEDDLLYFDNTVKNMQLLKSARSSISLVEEEIPVSVLMLLPFTERSGLLIVVVNRDWAYVNKIRFIKEINKGQYAINSLYKNYYAFYATTMSKDEKAKRLLEFMGFSETATFEKSGDNGDDLIWFCYKNPKFEEGD